MLGQQLQIYTVNVSTTKRVTMHQTITVYRSNKSRCITSILDGNFSMSYMMNHFQKKIDMFLLSKQQIQKTTTAVAKTPHHSTYVFMFTSACVVQRSLHFCDIQQIYVIRNTWSTVSYTCMYIDNRDRYRKSQLTFQHTHLMHEVCSSSLLVQNRAW